MPREVVIGTSDGSADVGVPSAQEIQQERPSLAAVEAHVQQLRHELCGNAHAGSGYATQVRITASEFARVAALVDLLDQLRYWSIEESTTFAEEPSALAEAEAPEAVVACACSGRPPLIAQALRVVQPMLHHPQTAWELRRVVRQLQQSKQRREEGNRNRRSREEAEEAEERETGTEVDGVAEDDPIRLCDPLLVLLADVMEHHAGAVPLLTEAIATATTVVQVVLRDLVEGESDDVLRRRVDGIVDALYETPLVFLIEAAMRRFTDAVQLQVNGTAFFAALVDLPTAAQSALDNSTGGDMASDGNEREGPSEEKEESTAATSLADVVAHSDGVLDVLQCAMQRHRSHLSLCRSVLHVWQVCAQVPSGRVPLLRHGVYGAVVRQLTEAGPYTLDVYRDAAEVIGYLIPLLDVLQRRSLVGTLRGILQRRPQLDVIEVTLALLVAVLAVVATHREKDADDGQLRRGASNTNTTATATVAAMVCNATKGDPFAMYAMCPQPPSAFPSSTPSCVVDEKAPGSNASSSSPSPPLRLQLSPMFWQPAPSSLGGGGGPSGADDGDTWRFALQRCALPQLVSGVRAYFTTCEVVDEKDAADVQRVCALADAVLSNF